MHWPIRGDSTERLSKVPIYRCRTIFHLTITVHPCSQQSAFFSECERPLAAGVSRPEFCNLRSLDDAARFLAHMSQRSISTRCHAKYRPLCLSCQIFRETRKQHEDRLQ